MIDFDYVMSKPLEQEQKEVEKSFKIKKLKNMKF